MTRSLERDGLPRRPDAGGRADLRADLHDPAAGAAAPHARLRLLLRAGRRVRRRHVLRRLQRAQRQLHVC